MAVNNSQPAAGAEAEEEWEAVHYSTSEMEAPELQPPASPTSREMEAEWEMPETGYSSPEAQGEWEIAYSNPELEWETHETQYSSPYSAPEMEEEWEAGVHYSTPEAEGEYWTSMGPTIRRAIPLLSRVSRPAIRALLPAARQAAASVAQSVLGSAPPPRAALPAAPPRRARPRTTAQTVAGLFRQLSQIFGEAEAEVQELEAAMFGANEFEGELAPHEAAYEAALTEVLAAEAAHTASEAEAEALLGAALPITIRIMGGSRALRRVQPTMVRANARLVRSLRRSGPGGPQLLRTVPAMQRRTVASLKAAQRAGRPITPTLVSQVMAGQAARVLNTPHICGRALVRNNAIRRSTVAAPARRPRRRHGVS